MARPGRADEPRIPSRTVESSTVRACARRCSSRRRSSRSTRCSRCSSHPPRPEALVLLLAGWAIFVVVLSVLLRRRQFVDRGPRPVARPRRRRHDGDRRRVPGGLRRRRRRRAVLLAGVTAARIAPERAAPVAIAARGARRGARDGLRLGDAGAGVTVGVTVGTISLTLFALTAAGRANRELRRGAGGARRAGRRRGAHADRARPPRHARPQPVAHRPQERAGGPGARG